MQNHEQPEIVPQVSFDAPLSLMEYAQHHHITVEKVWDLIEEGELSARFHDDDIRIVKESRVEVRQAAQSLPYIPIPSPDLALEASEGIEEIPENETKPEMESTSHPVNSQQAIRNKDHEDLHDFLLFAQDAMERTMDLSRQLIRAKDEQLLDKERLIQELQTRLTLREQEVRRLTKRQEDLETFLRVKDSP